MLKRIWLFLRIVWRGGDAYLPERISIKTAWKVGSIIWGQENSGIQH